MKFFIALTVFCFLSNTLAVRLEDELKAAETECLKDQHLAKYDDFGTTDLKNPTPALKTYAGCFFNKLGLVKDGVLQEDVILQKAKNFEYPKYFKHCVRVCHGVKGTDHDDTSYKLGLCFLKVQKTEFLKEWKNVCEGCKEEVGLSEDEYTKLQNLPAENTTTAMKKYAACVLVKEGFLKDNVLQDSVVLEVAEDYKDAEYLKTFVKQCKEVKESNQDDTALKLFECLQKIKATHVE